MGLFLFFLLEKTSCYYIRKNKSRSGLYTSLTFPAAYSGVFSSSWASGNSALYELQQTLHSGLWPLENSVCRTFAFLPHLLSNPLCSLCMSCSFPETTLFLLLPPTVSATLFSKHSYYQGQKQPLPTSQSSTLIQAPFWKQKQPQKNHKKPQTKITHKFVLCWELWNWERFRSLLFIQVVVTVLQKKS